MESKKGMVKRIFVEKKKGMDVEAQAVASDLTNSLMIEGISGLRVLNRYDCEGIDDSEYEKAINTIFSEPNCDNVYREFFTANSEDHIFASEYLPGQYDQRADSASQCLQILTQKERPLIKAARVYVLSGDITDESMKKIKKYLINPVESREASLDKPDTLDTKVDIPVSVATLTGFTDMSDEEAKAFREEKGLAMSYEDLILCREYFKNTEKRDPTITEIKVIDTYWSDHCRHTTFLTNIENITFAEGEQNDIVKNGYEEYIELRKKVYEGRKAKAVTLMDIATIGAKYIKKEGKLADIDESEEINACSINVKVNDGKNDRDMLVMFKNETHNHPTEIEPFGGAATCLGGAIRDPLSGRSYVYQAMRVTGSGDPTVPVSETIAGKLPQRKITTTAAAGYSSYGNQIGLATGHVREIYHPGYIAKRMEIGAVIAAAPKENVIRIAPECGDVVILLGGATGRDGIGGATGSSKGHTATSVLTCGSEVQKGNPPTERKLQRLFRNPNASKLIKRCNDFGAGGVCVAIGELSPSLRIDLNKVPKKYEGLDGTELAISESQERMAVVVAKKDSASFIAEAEKENLEAVEVADILDTGLLEMVWNGKTIVSIQRDFLDTNGAKQYIDISVKIPAPKIPEKKIAKSHMQRMKSMLTDLNSCSQKGLEERFDSSIGAKTVLMPYGGTYQLTPSEGMAARIPLTDGETNTCTLMSYGFDPYVSEISPYIGAMYAVVDSAAKITAMGGLYKGIRLTFQEYFEKPGSEPEKWGKPFSALLGALKAQIALDIPAIGGKDSMSGTFEKLTVPPTLVSFAVDIADAEHVISSEFKKEGHDVYVYTLPADEHGIPDFEELKKNYTVIHNMIMAGSIKAAKSIKAGGIAEAVCTMCFGNKLGFTFGDYADNNDIYAKSYGSIVFEVSDVKGFESFIDSKCKLVGSIKSDASIDISGETLDINELIDIWQSKLSHVFPTYAKGEDKDVSIPFAYGNGYKASIKYAKPEVFIPVFPGTNCEYDSKAAFEKAGAKANVFIFRNLKGRDIEYSVDEMVKLINRSQMIMIPGGFSGGDEPDGSGKFIATAFRNPYITEAVHKLLKERDGLMLGICNGFQALIKLGLLTYGEIHDVLPDEPTLTFNTIGRHISRMVYTKVVSNRSPWLSNMTPGEIHAIPISHGEGRFFASEKSLLHIISSGQVAFQYCDNEGNVTMDPKWNPNGSMMAIEGITSPDGRILGKMGHSERNGCFISKNVPMNKYQGLFEAGVSYFA